jgi:hypothetical protein
MADHALVVGCDAYPKQPNGNLRGAVADALAVRDWLLSRDGRAMTRRQITFLASCSSEGAQAGPDVVDGPAELGDFAEAVRELVAKPAADAREGDRLFVYLAGHGCRTDPLNPVLAQDAFVFSEFSPKAPAAACVTVPDLEVRLRQSRFGIILVVLDACRDFPFRRPIRPGGLDEEPEAPRKRNYEPRLFLLQSTLPGRTSRGQSATGATGTVRGDFTVALLDGLRGAGAAKTYDETRDHPYLVRWSSLVSYLEAAVPHQAPRGSGEGDLVLASFPDDHFDPVRLTVEVDPGQFADAADLRICVGYTDPSARTDPELTAAGPAPVDFAVPPRRQRVVAAAGDAWGKRAVDVYTNDRVLVPMFQGGPPRASVRPDVATVYRGVNQAISGAVLLQSDDPAAVVQVRTVRGLAALSGIGSVAGQVAPGMYTAVLIGSNGRPRTEPVEVEELMETRAEMTAPGPASPLFRSRRGLLDLPSEMGWASDAAALAWFAHRASGTLPLALAIAGIAGSPADRVVVQTRNGSATAQLHDFTRNGDPWWGLALPAWQMTNEASWLTVELRGHTLTVPGLPGCCTAVALGTEGLVAAIFDHKALGSPLRLAVLDRSQSLLDAGEHDAAMLAVVATRVVTGQDAGLPADRAHGFPSQATEYAAAVVWNAASHGRASHGIVASVDPADAVDLLPAGPWALFVDHPAARPLPIGELPSQLPAIRQSF